MANPTDRKYSKEHEWIKVDGDLATVGITDFAQDQLTDIVFVELPEVGRQVGAGDAVAVLGNVNMHCGEIACLKGLQGGKGYPM